MYNILEELGYNDISKFINSEHFKTYVTIKLENKTVGEGKPLISDILNNTLMLDKKISMIHGQSTLNSDIEDYIKDVIRKRKINKIINKMK